MRERHLVSVTIRLIAPVAAVALVAVGCTDSSGDDSPTEPIATVQAPAVTGGIGAIDGPATVDPSYDPFATVAP